MEPSWGYVPYQVLHVQPVEQASVMVGRVVVKIVQVRFGGWIVNLHTGNSLLPGNSGNGTKIHVAGACHVALAKLANI